MGEVSRYPHGTFCWVDLATTDVPVAKKFYGRLFGWESARGVTVACVWSGAWC